MLEHAARGPEHGPTRSAGLRLNDVKTKATKLLHDPTGSEPELPIGADAHGPLIPIPLMQDVMHAHDIIVHIVKKAAEDSIAVSARHQESIHPAARLRQVSKAQDESAPRHERRAHCAEESRHVFAGSEMRQRIAHAGHAID